ncbi:hypothetical protein ThidrDRAFT_1349 [Thiorhodococcus drewsii AZ1]|uniref:DUF4114 domain-containing protein n=1 Tax=Thiorhodococcus drewsii AZ1 TaxID=765913 RepID=G2DYZ0_9GAMM|nr:hypothetical protein [Thiorhodococcus drewsii]EGV32499.1 hypothetical protein ThidrDRAFT_1349 [Thiorhodococcus drewsii AZ1]
MKKTCNFIALIAGLFSSFSALSFPIAEQVTEGFKVIVNTNSNIIATYQGNSATCSNDLYLMLKENGTPGDDGDFSNDLFIFNNHGSQLGSQVNLGQFPVGTELIFRIFVNSSSSLYCNGDSFYTGPSGRNPDDHTHARVQNDWQPNEALVSFEDLYDGIPDGFDYNDLSFSFANVEGERVEKPEIAIKGGYFNFSTLSGNLPENQDCQLERDYGRAMFDELNGILYICGPFGWISK